MLGPDFQAGYFGLDTLGIPGTNDPINRDPASSVFLIGNGEQACNATASCEAYTPENSRNTAPTAYVYLPSSDLSHAFGAPIYYRLVDAETDAARIAITAGASGGLLCVAALYVEPGDEILVPDPGYPGYRHFVRAFEGTARALPVSARENFQPTLEMVRAAWGPRTKGVLLGSPSNPTGTLIDASVLRQIASFVEERKGVLIVDEIYCGLGRTGVLWRSGDLADLVTCGKALGAIPSSTLGYERIGNWGLADITEDEFVGQVLANCN